MRALHSFALASVPGRWAVPSALAAMACTELTGKTLPARSNGLRSKGARIETAAILPAKADVPETGRSSAYTFTVFSILILNSEAYSGHRVQPWAAQ